MTADPSAFNNQWNPFPSASILIPNPALAEISDKVQVKPAVPAAWLVWRRLVRSSSVADQTKVDESEPV